MYRAVDQHGQIIDVLVWRRRDGEAARRFFQRMIARLKVRPSEVVTDGAAIYPAVLDELLPSAWLGLDVPPALRVATAFTELVPAI